MADGTSNRGPATDGPRDPTTLDFATAAVALEVCAAIQDEQQGGDGAESLRRVAAKLRAAVPSEAGGRAAEPQVERPTDESPLLQLSRELSAVRFVGKHHGIDSEAFTLALNDLLRAALRGDGPKTLWEHYFPESPTHSGCRVAGESVTDAVAEETSRLFAERDRLLDMLRRVRVAFLDNYVGLAPEIEVDLLALLGKYGDDARAPSLSGDGPTKGQRRFAELRSIQFRRALTGKEIKEWNALISAGDGPAEPTRTAWQIVRRIVDRQAGDLGLWYEAETASEAYVQKELRVLHAAVERATGGEAGGVGGDAGGLDPESSDWASGYEEGWNAALTHSRAVPPAGGTAGEDQEAMDRALEAALAPWPPGSEGHSAVLRLWQMTLAYGAALRSVAPGQTTQGDGK